MLVSFPSAKSFTIIDSGRFPSWLSASFQALVTEISVLAGVYILVNLTWSGCFDTSTFSLLVALSFVIVTSTSYSVSSYVIPVSEPFTSEILYLCFPICASVYVRALNLTSPFAAFFTVSITSPFSFFNVKLYFSASNAFPSSVFLAPNSTDTSAAGVYLLVNLTWSGCFDTSAFSLFVALSVVTVTTTSCSVWSYVIPCSFPWTSEILYL